MIDKTYLIDKYSDTDKEGHYAEFYPSGQLRHLGFYKHGTCADHWALYLEDGEEKGQAIIEHGSGGNADMEIYNGGTSDKFDAWSDNTRPHTIPFETWAKGWIERIFQYH